MSLIRKPDVEVFRDSSAVTALRGAQALVKEGGGGVARTLSTLWLSMMLAAFMLTGLGYVTKISNPLALIVWVAVEGAAGYALWRMWRRPTREKAIEQGAEPFPTDISVPLPDHLHVAASGEGFHINYWPKAFVNKATLLLVAGLILIPLDGRSIGWISVLGVVMIARALLLMSLFFGGGVCVTASRDSLAVHSLLGKGEMLWTDITDVSMKTFDRRDYWVVLKTGARKHIAVTGHHRLGEGQLLIPYELLGLDDDDVRQLVRRLLTLAEMKRSAPRPAHVPIARAAPRAFTPVSEVNQSFDPDAIIARYMAEREDVVRAHEVSRNSIPTHHELPPPRIGGFGRKGL